MPQLIGLGPGIIAHIIDQLGRTTTTIVAAGSEGVTDKPTPPTRWKRTSSMNRNGPAKIS